MTMTMGARGELRSAPRVRPVDTQSTFLARWLRVWVLVLVVVAAVVVAFLVLITNTLASINGNLGAADRAVAGTGRNVVPLPTQVDAINGALAAIDPALKPIPGQADQIIAALSSINGTLGTVDSSLKDTSSVLNNVLPSVVSIRDVLINADDPPDGLGVQNIHRRITAVNGRGSAAVAGAAGGGGCGEYCTASNLTTAEQDARNILAQLVAVNGHLNSVCHSFIVNLAAGGTSNC